MEHKTVSLADQIFIELENNILTGVYSRGDIFTEMNLSEMLGVSRTPVREAIRRLEQERLVDITTKGVVIMGISPKDISDMYEIRLRTEGLASRWAANVMSEDAKKDADNIKNMDSKFHEIVYNNCGSIVLSDMLHQLHRKVMKYRKASVSNNERAFQSTKEHREILDAILAGDADKAEKLTVEHIKNAKENIEKTVKE